MSDSLNIVHLGLGSFHRAHQAVYLQHLIEKTSTPWRIIAGNTRNDMSDTVAALRAQGGKYTVETVNSSGLRNYLEVSSISQVIPWQIGLSALLEQMAEKSTRIISFTVTEAGYYQDKDDLVAARRGEVGGAAGATLFATLYAALKLRMQKAAGPVTLLNCDNLRHNGDKAKAGFKEFVKTLGDSALAAWVDTNTRWPNAMVDRITPRPSASVVERVKQATGRDDRAAIMAESFIQWVVEDNFINGRPEWEKVGVEMVDSVAAYEEAKIRLLNATHSCIAWAGTLRGYRYIHEGTLDQVIYQFAHDYATLDAIPMLQPSPIDLAAYRDVVLDRFSNPAIEDTNQRVAMDGFSKIPGFIVPTIRERSSKGLSIDAVAMLPALFLACLQRWHLGQLPYEYQDQVMDPAVAHSICASPDPVAALVADRSLWLELAGDTRLLDAVRRAYQRVLTFQSK